MIPIIILDNLTARGGRGAGRRRTRRTRGGRCTDGLARADLGSHLGVHLLVDGGALAVDVAGDFALNTGQLSERVSRVAGNTSGSIHASSLDGRRGGIELSNTEQTTADVVGISTGHSGDHVAHTGSDFKTNVATSNGVDGNFTGEGDLGPSGSGRPGTRGSGRVLGTGGLLELYVNLQVESASDGGGIAGTGRVSLATHAALQRFEDGNNGRKRCDHRTNIGLINRTFIVMTDDHQSDV